MDREEFDKAKEFLNNKKQPSSQDIIKLLFDSDEFENMVNPELSTTIPLGEPDDIKTIKGTEWIISRLIWNSPEGPICEVNLVKVGTPEENIIDIDYEEVKPIPFNEQLEIALETENFEEAARLRDWNDGFKELLLELKPKIINALNNENPTELDEYLTQIRSYRNTL